MKLTEKHMSLFKEIISILRKHDKLDDKLKGVVDYRNDLIGEKDALCVFEIFDSLVNFWEGKE